MTNINSVKTHPKKLTPITDKFISLAKYQFDFLAMTLLKYDNVVLLFSNAILTLSLI
jgi:hypothetical protein